MSAHPPTSDLRLLTSDLPPGKCHDHSPACNSALRTPRSALRSAFTLVELLIAMVLTLILITSIAQFYAIVGDSVKDGRAVIEMGGQMRAAVERLRADLDQITVSVVPWTDDGAASGYFEYFEGRGNDYDANGNGTADGVEDVVGAGGVGAANTIPDLIDVGVSNMIGDGDDYIAFTIRSDLAPFTGRYTYPLAGTAQIVPAQLAEVVWWVGFDDGLGATAGVWDFNEPRQLYRRQLLIRPDLTGIDNNTTHATLADAQTRLRSIWQENDISLSIRAEYDSGSDAFVYRIRPNSLADLSKRENRFAHNPIDKNDRAATPTIPRHLEDLAFPHKQLLMPSYSAKSSGVSYAGTKFSYVLQNQNGNPAESRGEDIILSNLLGFDVQVYDPYVRLWPDSGVTTTMTPSDPGYAAAASAGTAATMVGLGGYVDLNYYRYVGGTTMFNIDNNLRTSNGFPMPHFADAPSVPSNLTGSSLDTYKANFGLANSVTAAPYPQGVTYDTWALSYERDGVDQSGGTNYDQQSNGVDDDGRNGADDIGERETAPPYSQPIRGLRVRIRLYEPSTRQVRQATVAADFINE